MNKWLIGCLTGMLIGIVDQFILAGVSSIHLVIFIAMIVNVMIVVGSYFLAKNTVDKAG